MRGLAPITPSSPPPIPRDWRGDDWGQRPGVAESIGVSLHETPMLRRYWDRVGGTLAEELTAVPRSAGAALRRIDGVIVLGGEHRLVAPTELVVAGRDIIVVQVKRLWLGMSLMGQAVFSRELMKPFMPASIRTVALCGRDDALLRPLAERYGIKVEIDDLPRG